MIYNFSYTFITIVPKDIYTKKKSDYFPKKKKKKKRKKEKYLYKNLKYLRV